MALPLYDDDPFKRAALPYVTWGLIALNIGIFLVQITSSEVRAIRASFGMTPATVISHLSHAGQIPSDFTLVTYMFLHAGWMHLLGNMLYLLVFGDDIEEALGPLRFFAFYLLTGAASAIVYIFLNTTSTAPLVGASGAVSGVLAAYLLLRPCANVSVTVFGCYARIPAYLVIGGWVLPQLYMAVGHPNDGVAYTGHVAGLVVGALLFFAMRPAGVHLLECIAQPGEEEWATPFEKQLKEQRIFLYSVGVFFLLLTALAIATR
jgi:membrane associated rhomboid family serine protease